jgi:hypothetical protein
MVPPRLVRRLVLAPLAIVVAAAMVVLFPPLALLTLLLGALGRSRPHRMRALRLLSFALIWLVAETATLFMCLGLWLASGFGGQLHTEPYQSRHYAIMQWYLDRLYLAAVSMLGLRVEVDEPPLTPAEQAARLAGPVIVLSRHAGPGDSLLLVHHLLTVYRRRPRVVMKAALQLDPSVDVVANRVPNVFIQGRRTGEHIFVAQISRLASGLDPAGALVLFPGGRELDAGPVAARHPAAGAAGPRRPGRAGPGHAAPAAAAGRRGAVRHRGLPGGRRDLRGARRAGHAGQRGRRLAQPADRARGPGQVVAGARGRGAPRARSGRPGPLAVRLVAAHRRLDSIPLHRLPLRTAG